MKKRIISIILALATLVSVFAMSTVPAYAIADEVSNSTPLSTQPSLPLTSSATKYVVGKYFNKNFTSKCEDHSTCEPNKACNCIHYGGGIQCVAFARYVYDRYYHRTKWYTNASESADRKKGEGFTSTAELYNELKKIPLGSYVRFRKKSDHNKGHSFILISYNASEVTMYDANYKGACLIAVHTEKYSDLIKNYDGVVEWFSHNYSYSKYSSSQHKATCKTSGCGGYIYEAHAFKYTKNGAKNHTATCTKCGYSETQAHSLKYTSNNGSKHTGSCSKCSYSGSWSHDFTYTKKSTTTHIAKCSSCGYSCTENHFADSPGTNVRCLGCGYVGNIAEGRLSVGDETASIDNDTSS